MTILKNKARELGVIAAYTKSFVVRIPKKIKGMPRMLTREELLPTGYHVVLGRDRIDSKIGRGKAGTKRKKQIRPLFSQIVALVAKEVDGKVVSVTKVYSKSPAVEVPRRDRGASRR
jgi:hypothetical protein